MITWKDEYRIGHPEIDHQHKQLLEIGGRILSLIKNNLVIDKYDRITELVSELADYTVYHFNFEEQYMKEAGYRNLPGHKAEHDSFVEKINAIDLNELDENQDKYLMELLDFVLTWVRDHILEKDKQITAQ